jgi:hypothetical protein
LSFQSRIEQVRDFSRGEAKVRGEWNLVCVALNLKRFHRLQMA